MNTCKEGEGRTEMRTAEEYRREAGADLETVPWAMGRGGGGRPSCLSWGEMTDCVTWGQPFKLR